MFKRMWPFTKNLSCRILTTGKFIYLKGLTPLEFIGSKSASEAKLLSNLRILASRQDNPLTHLFYEPQYNISLLTAHLVFEHIEDENLKQEALAVIRKYAQTKIDPRLAEQESHWLKRRGLKPD